jgi:hypothetical protein
MVKITYNLDNKEESEMVDDYFFMKYYLSSIHDDWKQYLNYCFDEYNTASDEIINTIFGHLNEIEFNRLKYIFEYRLCQKFENDVQIFNLIFYYFEIVNSTFKKNLIKEFGNN